MSYEKWLETRDDLEILTHKIEFKLIERSLEIRKDINGTTSSSTLNQLFKHFPLIKLMITKGKMFCLLSFMPLNSTQEA